MAFKLKLSSCARRFTMLASAAITIVYGPATFAQGLGPSEGAPPPIAKQSAAANMCWTPEVLAGRATDKTIVKDTPRAIVDPPREVLAPYSPAARGAIRRVELPPGVKKIAFTFDNCEQPYEVAGYDAEIVNTLRANNVRATFFAGGKWMMTHPEQAQQLLSDPLFEVGNHSWEHRNLRLLEGQRQVDEIRWAQTAYERQVTALDKRQCAARDGRPFTKTKVNARMGLFRFPFGACNPAALDAAAELGVLPIQWDVSSGDPTKGLAPEKMATETMRRIRPGSIVLFHANGRGWSTAAALKIMIPALKANGFEFATVGDLLNTKGAKWIADPICYDSKPGDADKHDALARRLDEAYQRFYAKFSVKPAASLPAPPHAPSTQLPPPAPVPAVRPAPSPVPAEPVEQALPDGVPPYGPGAPAP